MYWHFAAVFVLALLCAAGLFYRVSAALLCAALTYVFLLDKAQYLNHLYLLCLLGLLLAVAPAHRALSLDLLRARRASPAGAPPSMPTETVPRFHLFALKAQVAIVYFYGGVAKLNGDWLRGQPLTMWLAEHADAPVVGPLLASPATGLALSYAGLLIDLSMGFLLFSRRTFPLGAAIAVAFNLSNAFLFKIGIFPYAMIASLALFADPSWPRRRLPFLFGRADRAGGGVLVPGPAPAPSPAASWRRALPLAVLHAYLLLHLVVPLRHWLYPGDVAWNEAGHRFSWRMKLRDKNVSELDIGVMDPRTGVRESLDLEEWLTDRQLGEMSTRPDMIVDFAHHVADRWQQAFGVRPVVTAKVVASFVESRKREGAALEAMLLSRIVSMEEIIKRITPLIPQVIAQFQQKAVERMQDALGLAGHGTPQVLTRQEVFERIRQEVTLYGIRIDVSEELSRLTAHLNETRHILKKGGQVGKRLDFMMQELNREANTLGAKASVKELADASMELKLLIEQMREQVQNLE